MIGHIESQITAINEAFSFCPTGRSTIAPPIYSLPATVTDSNLVDGTTYFMYMGRVQSTVQNLWVAYRTTAAYVAGDGTGQYCELGAYRGNLGLLGPTTLHRVEVDDVSGDPGFASTAGVHVWGLNTAAFNPGDDVWLAIGYHVAGSGATAPTLAAFNPDYLGFGLNLSISGRPSTITDPCTTFSVVGNTIKLPVIMPTLVSAPQ